MEAADDAVAVHLLGDRALIVHPFGTALASGDVDGAIACLAPSVVFRSPIVFHPYEGRDAVAPVIHAVAHVLEDFRYVREIADAGGQDHALAFRARVAGREVEGCDFIHANDEGLVDELVVMVRPLTGALGLAEAMRALLDAG